MWKGARLLRGWNSKKGDRGTGTQVGGLLLLALHPEAGHQELDSWDGCLALEWPLATVPERHLFTTPPWEASPLALSQQLSSFSQLSLGTLAAYPEGPTAQPRVRQRYL